MRQMKDSGIEWIGEIPENWNVERNKQLFYEVNDRCENGDEHTLLSVSEYFGIAPKSEKISDGEFETRAETLDGYKLCEIDDIVMNIMLAWKRATGRSDYNGIVSPAYCVYRKKADIDTHYYHYLFRTDIVANLFKQYSTGIIDSRLRLYPDKFLALQMIVPPLPEQQAISAYLDRQCSHIDSVIEKTKASVEEYKKLRQAVITQAVTKGVRGERPMKYSGIEWIGEIPEEWEIAKIKVGVTKVGSGKTPSGGAETYATEGVLLLRSQNIYDSGLNLDSPTYIAAQVDEEMKNTRVQPNDVLLNITGGSIGRCCIFPPELKSANVNQHVSIIRVIDSIFTPEYMHYYWNSDIGKKSIALYQTGGNREGMSADAIKNSPIMIMSLDEQKEIAAYLDTKCIEIDSLISKKEQFLTELESYKKSMIYEYVTGKKEVPQS